MTTRANATLTQFSQYAQISSLDTAVSLHREALDLQGGSHADRPFFLGGLAKSLVMRFYRTNQLHDLDEAILLYHEAIPISYALAHSERLCLHSNLTAALLARFQKTTQPPDLCDTISMHTQASILGISKYVPPVMGSHNQPQLWVRGAD